MDSLLLLRHAGGFQSLELERVQSMCRFQSSASSRLRTAGADCIGGPKFAALKLMRPNVGARINPEAIRKRENTRMSRMVHWLRIGAVSGIVIVTVIEINLPAGGASSLTPPYCGASAYRQFDFWAGDWDVFEVGNSVQVAHARVDLILDGCVLREKYQGTDGHQGQSFNIYDASRHLWHQSWVTNRGEMLEIEGKIEGDEMVLSGKDDAKGELVRGVWKPVNGGVRETAVTSTDGGKTWKPWFDLMFLARPDGKASAIDGSGTTVDDKKIVGALDTEYQAAVKNNDAPTMDRILADEFALVTGSGKIYTKADLLAEARSGRMHYERQDDTDQTVRVWGDTAVVTARLTEKGTDDGKRFEYEVWFSDTYVRTASGWRYAFAQSSLPLPPGSR
jgi:ketosteroid isomerase-like protein